MKHKTQKWPKPNIVATLPLVAATENANYYNMTTVMQIPHPKPVTTSTKQNKRD